jgi:hypothetical protein
MVKMKFSYRILALVLGASGCLHGAVVITANTPVIVDPREPLALRKAAADLASDLEKVFGRKPELRAEGSAGIVIALERNLPTGIQRPKGREVLEIRGLKNAVLLTGSDMRGAIYAVYQFSQSFLGVDPMYFWTDHAPARRSSVPIADGLRITDGPPSIRYRGWFINDEDLLTGWKPGNAQGTGIALEVWDKLFESVLRLKGNMIVPGTFLFPDEPQVRAAGERGLIISQHHIEVVGTNTYRWPDNVPYSFGRHPDLLIKAWQHAIDAYAPNQEVIWTVGYRGRHDRPFWEDDQSAVTDRERADQIAAAIAKQMELVRRNHPNAYFLMNAWQESVPFIRSGLLKLPAGVTLVWPDNGHGILRDGGTIAKGQGVYYHTAMYNYRANQLTEMIPLERIERELGRAKAAGATEYLLLNTSDVRPVPMTTRGAMELAWSSQPWHADAYLKKWCREEFGERAAPAMEAYYRAYFRAPGRRGDAEEHVMADTMYHTYAREVLVRLIQGGEATSLAPIFAMICRQAAPRWAEARALAMRAAPLIPAGRRDFFRSHVLTQLDVQEYSNRMLIDLGDAVRTGGSLEPVAADIQKVIDALHRNEYGQWAGFYRKELFTSAGHTLALLRAYQAQEAGKPLPAGLPITVLPPDPYPVIKAYQGARKVQVEP